MKERIVIATIKSWNIENTLKFKRKYNKKHDVTLIFSREDLKYADIEKIRGE